MSKLIQAETTAEKGELAAAEIISAELGRSGIDSRIDNWDGTRANITAQIKSSGHKSALLFACHLDVVPPGQESWKHPAFGAIESEGKIYGRGSTDMKGGIAAIVTAIGEIANSGTKIEGDIIFFGAAGEETDSCGTKRFVSNCGGLPEITGVVLTEPTDFEIITAHRGMLWLKVQTFGKTAHSSTPKLGVNAIASMKSVLDELENFKIRFEPHELLGECSMSINTIAGGEAMNVVPDKCEIGIDIRTVPGQKQQDIINDLQKIFAKLKQTNPQFEAEVSIIREVGALETDTQCDFVRDFCSVTGINKTCAVGFTTDGPHFASLNLPVVIFGPGKPHLAHKPDEYIDIADVQKAVKYYKNIILKFLS
ncbi:MAG: M20 family metallopeptidase [Phycisphaerae bacterium]|nr:M20 family metallopeptidase [Phycisphaerae bacterium]NIP55973.1 M20 family metallopeptidase [Phycisphaerae bacterium]NIX02385.1 ArgE/DapE family deacylase [Phycisphaerae bacterium]NIX30078.1 ArgE/DapE family deacylase [Phycisphaerae bacterium]